MLENAGQLAASASLLRCRAAGCPAFLALRCFCIAACAALCVALVPLSVELNPASFHVQGSDAIADEGGGSSAFYDATGFIDAVSQAADLTQSQFVSTVVGIVAGGTGLNMADGDIAPDISLSQNLDALAAAANYPDYDTLSAEEKAGWGSKTNYDAAKFNDLLIALGQGGALQRYKASGGGDFDFTSDEAALLEDISTVGKTWLNRGSVAVQDLTNLVSKNSVVKSYGPIYEYYEVPVSETLWPSGWDRNIRVWVTDKAYRWEGNRTLYSVTDRLVYVIQPFDGRNYLRFFYSRDDFYRNGSNTGGYVVPTFTNDITTGNYGTGAQYVVGGELKYYYYTVGGSFNASTNVNIQPPVFNVPGGTVSYVNAQKAALVLLGLSGRQNYVEVVNYPDVTPSGETPIYFPGQDDGNAGNLTRETPWQQFITQPTEGPYVPPAPEERPQNPYNPSNPENPQYQSGTPEWKETTTENMQPLLNVRLDRLFPFCLLYDLNTLWGKVQGLMQQNGLSGQDYEDYLHIRFPIQMVSPDLGIYIQEQIEFDLTPLHDLLLMTKQAVFVLLIFMTLLSLIRFWQRILTGG